MTAGEIARGLTKAQREALTAARARIAEMEGAMRALLALPDPDHYTLQRARTLLQQEDANG